MKAPLDLTRTAIPKQTCTEFSFKGARIKLILLALIQLKCAEQNSRQIGRAASSALFAVTRNTLRRQQKKYSINNIPK
jgi:thymidylate synthase ThyX